MFKKIIGYPFVLLIMIYQKIISPHLGNHCRYIPSCSEYTKQAIKKYGPIKGIWLGLKRILKCGPHGGSGYDPLL
ncbi:MAG: membrane protein insertion efficiency factor YidD [Alphaproteobacteria bacterium]|nr:membrane protein insertion efficiency factor YidD [Alphaproteobacteria bacterium]